MKKRPLKYRVVIDPTIKITDDDICRLLFGLNMNELAKAITDNKGGKYDFLYEKSEQMSQ